LIFAESSISNHCLKVHCTKGQVGDAISGRERTGSGTERGAAMALTEIKFQQRSLVGLVIAFGKEFRLNVRGEEDASFVVYDLAARSRGF
jgi:hypothetical protein